MISKLTNSLAVRGALISADYLDWRSPFLQMLFIAVTGTWLALWLQPQPHSDWLYYWDAAGSLSRYERGGAGLLLLALLKSTGLSPFVAGLLLNLPCVMVLLGEAYRADQSTRKWYAKLVAGYLWLISPFYGIVQLDLVATALLALAVGLLLRQRSCGSSVVACALVLVVAAVSTKPQLALVLWAMFVLFLVVRCWKRRGWIRSIDVLMLVLLAGSLAGFAADYAIRVLAGQRDSMRTTSAVTLYAGLLVSGTTQGCGYWSVEAGRAAKADMDRPLIDAVASRLAARPISHWLQVVACKAPEIVLPPSYALYWLVESPNVLEGLHRHPQRERLERAYAIARKFERLAYAVLAFVILVTVFVTGVRRWRRGGACAMLAPTWVFAFWLIHSVFEIQGRYFLPMFVLAPIFCALSVSLMKRGARAP